MTAVGRPSLAVDARMIAHSGIGTYLRNVLSRVLASGAFDCILLGNRETIARSGIDGGYSLLPMSAGIYGMAEQAELGRKVPACDLFWSPHYNVPLFPVRARKRVATIHDAYHLDFAGTYSLPKRAYARVLYQAAVSRSDKVITVSEFSKSRLSARLRVPPGRIAVIPNGVDPGFNAGFEPSPVGERYILFVGNVKPHKNLGTALEAFRIVLDEFPDLKFYIVGKNEGLITLDRGIGERIRSFPAGRIRVLGEVALPELKNYYSQAALFLFPSRYEGFGLPVLEAMSFGIPILCSDAGPIREVGGDAVAYCDPSDAGAMARGIRKALLEPGPRPPPGYSERLGAFEWWISAGRHLELFQGLVRS